MNPMTAPSKTRKMGAVIAMLLGIVMVCGACATTYRKPRPDLPESTREVTELRTLSNDFQRALRQGKVDIAEAMLEELQAGIAQATELSRQHWEFAGVKEAAEKGVGRLREAKEKKAVDAVIGRGREAIENIENAQLLCVSDDLSEDHVDTMRHAFEALEAIQKDTPPENGEKYGYDTFLASITEQMETWGQQVQACAWTFEVSEALRDIFSDLTDTDALVSAADWQERAQAFQRCQGLLEESAKKPGANNDVRLPVPGTRMTLPEAYEHCGITFGDADYHYRRLSWGDNVNAVLAQLKEAQQDYLADDEPKEQLGEIDDFKESLRKCQEITAEENIIEAERVFESAWGALDAAGLNARCAEVLAETLRAEPTLRWRAAFIELLAGIEDEESLSPGDRDVVFLKRCLDDSAALAQKNKAPWQKASPTRGEIKAAKGLWRRCDGLLKKVKEN